MRHVTLLGLVGIALLLSACAGGMRSHSDVICAAAPPAPPPARVHHSSHYAPPAYWVSSAPYRVVPARPRARVQPTLAAPEIVPVKAPPPEIRPCEAPPRPCTPSDVRTLFCSPCTPCPPPLRCVGGT